jgi:hypothetical protein
MRGFCPIYDARDQVLGSDHEFYICYHGSGLEVSRILPVLNGYCGIGSIYSSAERININGNELATLCMVIGFDSKADLIRYRLATGDQQPAYARLSTLLLLDQIAAVISIRAHNYNTSSNVNFWIKRMHATRRGSEKVQRWFATVRRLGWSSG